MPFLTKKKRPHKKNLHGLTFMETKVYTLHTLCKDEPKVYSRNILHT